MLADSIVLYITYSVDVFYRFFNNPNFMLQWWYKIKGKTGVVGLVVAGFPRKIEKFKYSQVKKWK